MAYTEKIKVWITKYALTRGVYATEATVLDGPRRVCFVGNPFGVGAYFHDAEWHLRFEDARDQAEHMRERKLIALRKQIARLEGLRFEERS